MLEGVLEDVIKGVSDVIRILLHLPVFIQNQQ